MTSGELRIAVDDRIGEVSARLDTPRDAWAGLVLGHGAGAGMRHPFLERVASELRDRGVATLRYQFPYMERARRRPDRAPILIATVRAAFDTARERFVGVPLFAGGKSMGGRMTSTAAADGLLSGVRGIAFIGFPLHPVGRPSDDRADHLFDVPVPMLFVQGTRDALADLSLLEPVCERIGSAATLHVVEGADHSFHMLKRSGRTDDEALVEVVDSVADWMRSI